MTREPERESGVWRIAAGTCLVLYFAILLAANSDVAGGSDSSGYLNAARLFLRGRVSEPIEILRRLSLPASDRDIFIPLGFRPGAGAGTMAPRYPPGLPLHMAAAAAVGGWNKAPFLLVPFSGAAALLLLFLLARELGLSRELSATGSALLAACPIFFGMAVQPMSDVVAVAWVLAALLLGLKARRSARAAIPAGAALGVALLVRPTNILAAIPLAFALPPRKRAFAGAALGILPLAGALLLYDLAAFGNAAETGYGAMLSWTMSWSHFLPEVRHYGRWVPALMTPLLPLAWLLFPLDRRAAGRDRLLLFTWFGAILGFYLFYEPYEDWWSTRFLLPGIPALIVSVLLLARDIPDYFPRAPARALRAGQLAVLALPVAVGVFQIRRFDLLSMWRGETVYRDASLWTAASVPRDSLVVSMQMSGALKYYTKLPIARWDAIRSERFSALRRAAEERGLVWYALLRPFEQEDFWRNVPGQWTRIGTVRDVSLWRLE